MEKERLVFVDRAKGIGIISLILGHLLTYGSVPFSIIFAFHMPLFFLVSGVFFKPPKNKEERNVWVKKVLVRYITPYVFFTIFGFVATILMGKDINWNKAGHDFIYTIGIGEFNVASLWFLIVLAFTHIILMFLIQGRRKFLHPQNVVIILLMFVYITTKIPVRIPFLLLSYFSTTLFVYVGYMYKGIIFRYIKMPTIWVSGGGIFICYPFNYK